MVTIAVELPDDLARQLLPLQDRLPEIIELGLRQLAVESRESIGANRATHKQRVLAALHSTGIVILPELTVWPQPRIRRTPVEAGGPPASEMIIAARRGK